MSIDTAIPTDVRREVEARLAAIETQHDVRILMAVESGSRAWGFPSPDSDYDVRFIYVRPRDWYLSLLPGRDVIETPIAEDIDLNGWDVRKALGLLLKSNATVSEWIESPLRYRPDDPGIRKLAALEDASFDARGVAYHYANLGRNAAERWLDAEGDVPVKAYFYALRPALAIRALRHAPGGRPPMSLQALVAASAVPEHITQDIWSLVAAKRRTSERANAVRVPRLDALIRGELERAYELPSCRADNTLAERANSLFLELVNH